MNKTTGRSAAAGILMLLVSAASGGAADVTARIKDLFPILSTTGNEERLAARIRETLPKGMAVVEDGLGGLAVTVGSGEPRTLVLAGLDDTGYFVSGITPEGYLTLDRAVPPPHSRYDGYLLGQPVVIATRSGLVQGVVSQPAIHLLTQERRKTLVENFSLESAFVDVAARSEREVRDRGIERLDPVAFRPMWTELASGRVAGTSLAAKTAAAVLAGLAEELSGFKGPGEIVLVWAAQTRFAARGRGARTSLGAVRARNLWKPQRVIVLEAVPADRDAAGPQLGKGPVLIRPGEGPAALGTEIEGTAAGLGLAVQGISGFESPLLTAFAGSGAEVVGLAVPVQFPATPSEIIVPGDAEQLCRLLAALLGKGASK